MKVPHVYGNEQFRKGFKVFCLANKSQLEKLEVSMEPHPWTQFRYQR